MARIYSFSFTNKKGYEFLKIKENQIPSMAALCNAVLRPKLGEAVFTSAPANINKSTIFSLPRG